MTEHENEEGPLTSEQLNRDKWRGDETFLDEEDAGGHTLPESERGGGRMKPADSKGRPMGPGNIAPPD